MEVTRITRNTFHEQRPANYQRPIPTLAFAGSGGNTARLSRRREVEAGHVARGGDPGIVRAFEKYEKYETAQYVELRTTTPCVLSVTPPNI